MMNRRSLIMTLGALAVAPAALAGGRTIEYTPGVIEDALHSRGSYRDFTDCPEQLLKFS